MNASVTNNQWTQQNQRLYVSEISTLTMGGRSQTITDPWGNKINLITFTPVRVQGEIVSWEKDDGKNRFVIFND
jgi:hypothetical protein